jgi:pyruvate dehydrogenase E1 component beta subunit
MSDARTSTLTYREALRLALREELERNDAVFLMGEEIGVFGGAYKITAGLLEEFGADRVRDTPISEEGFVGAAIGAAMLGHRPVVEIMTLNFILVAMDQVVNHAAKIHYMFGGLVKCPMVIRTPNGAGISSPRSTRSPSTAGSPQFPA